MFSPEQMDSWILAGQSNMEGVGDLADALEPDARVWAFSSAGQWEMARDPLHNFWESCTPIHQALMRPGLPAEQKDMSDAELAALQRSTRLQGAGLGIAFGKAMADALGHPIGLIPAAHGGTSLQQWDTALKQEGGNSLYGAMLQRIERSRAKIGGLLWYQGESDAYRVEEGETYGARFSTWVQQFRQDIGKPDLPVIAVQLAGTTLESPNATAWNLVRQAQYALPETVAHTAITSAIDLGMNDIIHIDTPGLIRLGKRLARLALALDGHAGYTLGPRLSSVEPITEAYGRGALRLRFTGVTGAWQPQGHMGGFTIHTADGARHPVNQVYQARRDHQDPTAIYVRMNLPMEPGNYLGYGEGLFPYCNVVDEADMPLCAFRWTMPTT